jgi:hypothetical protein
MAPMRFRKFPSDVQQLPIELVMTCPGPRAVKPLSVSHRESVLVWRFRTGARGA